ALQPMTVLAQILSRQSASYDTWNWEGQAVRRAVQYLYDLDQRLPGQGWAAGGDDLWIPWLVNRAYGSAIFPTAPAATPGKNMGWTEWTHGS
ncbi:MAG TPA: hypothetical protein VFV62_00310, partial [Gaiellaceae bacterium]|nr:hypothetical protein [Gaiellaceae bacterium]